MSHQQGHPEYDHGSAHDTLRWGDSHTFTGLASYFSDTSVPSLFSRQMIAAHWRWPLSWNLWVAIVPSFEAETTGIITITLQTTIGIGQAIATFPIVYTLSPTSGVYLPITDQKLIPAQDLQIIAQLDATEATKGVNDNLTIGVFVAPQTEPHAMTHLLDKMVHGERPEEVQWMPPGFNEAPMGYRR